MDDKRVLVAIRVRPKLEAAVNVQQASERYHLEAAAKTSDSTIRLSDGKVGRDGKTHNFSYDLVFDKDSTQLDVYEETTLDAVDAVLLGCNATIMTYGQTGSGKTYTVLGAVKKNPLTNDIITAETGLFLRALKDVLSYAEGRAKDLHVVVGLSVLEIYLDEVRDLLSPEPTPPVVNVAVIKDTLAMPGMTYKAIRDLNDAVSAFKLANQRRVCRATNANDTSSRSHAVFSIELFQQPRTPSNPEPMDALKLCEMRERLQLQMNTERPEQTAARMAATAAASPASPVSPPPTPEKPIIAGVSPVVQTPSGSPSFDQTGFASRASNPLLMSPGVPPIMFSKLVLTDLAGSEKMKNSKVKGEGLEELKKINGSLTALGNVVHNLYAGSKHIPYRDAKLTIILRESFAAPNSKIVLIANVSPTVLTFDETLSTMFFADKVKGMKVDNPQGADVAKMEIEYLSTLKSCEEVAADLHIVRELHDHPVVLRTMGSDDLVNKRFGIINRNSTGAPAQREKDLKALHERVAAVCRSIQEKKKREQAAELERIDKEIRDGMIGSYTETRAKVTTILKDVDVQRAKDEKETQDVLKELQQNINDDTKLEAVLAAELGVLEPKSVQLPLLKAKFDKELAELTEKVDIMERKFFEANREKEMDWERHQTNHTRQEAQWASSTTFAQNCKSLWSTKSQYISQRHHHLTLLHEVSQTRRDSELLDVTYWLRGAVTRIARNAVALSISKLRKAPSTRPTPKSSAASGSSSSSSSVIVNREASVSSRVDPNEGVEGADDRPVTRPKRSRGTLYDQPTLLGEILSYVQYGCMMLKYGRSGAPHYRIFYVLTTEEEGSRLCWDEQDDGKRLGKGSSLPLHSVTRVILGQFTSIFKRLPGAEGFYNSFSLEYISKQQLRTLDLVCDTDAELESWVIAICHLTKKNPTYGEPMLSVRNSPNFFQLSPTDAEFCATWHVTADVFLTTRKRIEDLKAKSKHSVMRLTPGELRLVANVDIFRACAMWRHWNQQGLLDNPLERLYSYLQFD